MSRSPLRCSWDKERPRPKKAKNCSSSNEADSANVWNSFARLIENSTNSANFVGSIAGVERSSIPRNSKDSPNSISTESAIAIASGTALAIAILAGFES